MTLLQQIQQRLNRLPKEKQIEALDFIEFLYAQVQNKTHTRARALKNHPAFGSWKGRHIDAVKYQRDLRLEWEA